MTDSGQRSDHRFEIEDELDDLFANASPNPNREGCPSREGLIALSRRERPIGHPDYLHLVRCSPCFREFRAIQQANKARTRARKLWAVAAAAAVALAVIGVWFARLDRPAGPGPVQSAQSTGSADRVATLDLRPYTVTRGDERKIEPGPLSMPTGRVDATLLLPVGAQPGMYDVRVLDHELRVQASARGSAEIRNYVTTLQTLIDVNALGSGEYQLALKRDGGEWQMYPLRVR